VRLDMPLGSLAARRDVAEADALGVPAGEGGARQDVRVNGGRLPGPGRSPGRGLGHRGHRLGPAAQPGGHDLGHLGQRAGRGVGNRPGGGEPQRRRHGDGLVVVEHQRRQHRARGQLVAAVHARVRRDRIAELAEPVHVPPERARGDAEPSGQLRARPEAVVLQQGQQPEGARAGIRHVLDSALH
jgi:hypothetical protein